MPQSRHRKFESIARWTNTLGLGLFWNFIVVTEIYYFLNSK